MIRIGSIVLSVLIAAGCQKESAPSAGAEPTKPGQAAAQASGPAAGSDHGTETALGRAAIAGFEFEVVVLGAIQPGSDAAVAMKAVKSPEGRDWRSVNVYVWVEDSDGKKLSAPEKARVEKDRLHAHTSVSATKTGTPATVVIRLRDGAIDERTSVRLTPGGGRASAGKHTHEATPHDGVLARIIDADGGGKAGWMELKLHDDKGDLELWLSTDSAGKRPLDLSLDAAISLSFVDHAQRRVRLAPRNRVKNEDEDGRPNIRDGRTGYFIFPGATGVDASWLVGKNFQSVAVLTIAAGGRTLRSEEFVLKPHSHHGAAAHR